VGDSLSCGCDLAQRAIASRRSGPARILYLANNPPENIMWGTEMCLLDLIDGLDADRYVPLAAVVQQNGVFEEALRQRSIRVLRTRLPEPARLGLGSAAAALRAARRCLRELMGQRPDLVHINNAGAAARTGVVLGRLCGASTVLHLHGRPRPREYVTSGAALTTVVVANSQFSAQGWDWWPARKRVAVVHSGTDLSRFRPSAGERQAARRELGLSETDFVIGCVGRGTAEKGHRFLLEALASCLSRNDSMAALLIGVPPIGHHPVAYPHVCQLHRLVGELGLSEQVRFLGFRTDVPRLLNALDLFIHPSLRESFGRAVVEAMATALPVVATRVGGLPDAVADGETGLLVPPADPGALGAAINRLRADPELRKTMGERGRLRAEEHFSIDAHIGQMTEIYESALRARRSKEHTARDHRACRERP